MALRCPIFGNASVPSRFREKLNVSFEVKIFQLVIELSTYLFAVVVSTKRSNIGLNLE